MKNAFTVLLFFSSSLLILISSTKVRVKFGEYSSFEAKKQVEWHFSFSPFYLQYGSELNNFAYDFFKHTNDLEKLAKALKWSKRSIEINEALVPDEKYKQNPYFMDTYASLLYRLGKKEEATETQTQAIEILKNRSENTSNLEMTLTKIRNGTL